SNFWTSVAWRVAMTSCTCPATSIVTPTSAMPSSTWLIARQWTSYGRSSMAFPSGVFPLP
ncbi:ML3, partial [Symbiodinium sp. CCMP2456]